jgi:hypothetical protein
MPVFDFSSSSKPVAKKIENDNNENDNNDIIQGLGKICICGIPQGECSDCYPNNNKNKDKKEEENLTNYENETDDDMPDLESFSSVENNNKPDEFDEFKKLIKENDEKTIQIFKKKFIINNNILYMEEDEQYEDLYGSMLETEKIFNTDNYKEYLKDQDFYFDNYSRSFSEIKNIINILEEATLVNDIGYPDLAVGGILNMATMCFKEFNLDYKYITYKDNDDKIYIYYKEDYQKDDIINDLSIIENIKPPSDSENNKYLNPYLQYRINKLKDKIKNNKLKKDLKFKLNGKEYTFSSNYIDETVKNTKKEKKIYSKSNYFEKYKNRITSNNIKELENSIKNNELNNKEFWDNYNKNKNINKDKINSLFKDDPIIDFDKELFYEKYKDKHYSVIYKDILLELDKLEKDYNNFKIIENNYNKLKEDINIKTVFKDENNKINALFTDYENNRVNEYKVLSEIGNLIVNNKLSKEEKKEINSLNENSRPYRVIKQSKRIYILNKFVDIKNIALSGISNWLRDTSDDNFELLVSFFST